MSWFRSSPAIPVKAIGPSNPKAKMRVLYVLDHYPELSESYIHSEIRILGEEYEIFVVALHGAYVCPNPEGYPFTELSNFSKLVKLVREVRPQVMHTHVLSNAKLLAVCLKPPAFRLPFVAIRARRLMCRCTFMISTSTSMTTAVWAYLFCLTPARC